MAAIAAAKKNADASAVTPKVLTQQEKEEREARLSCRYYEQEFPEVDEAVMVQVTKITGGLGAYVKLLEYNNIEGMILLSELSRRRIRSVNKLIRVDKKEVAMVMRVDKDKGYIDLSKRRVSPEDIIKCEERYSRGKAVHSIMRHVAETTGSNLRDLNENIAWPLARSARTKEDIENDPENSAGKHKDCYEAFRLAIADDVRMFKGLTISDDVRNALMKNIRRRLTPQPIKIRADIEVTCFEYEGIDAIRSALLEGQKLSTEEIPIKMKLIAPPLYVLLTQSLEKKAGIKALEDCIAKVTEVIQSFGGKIVVKSAPKATSAQEETELNQIIEKMNAENREVDGDDDGDD